MSKDTFTVEEVRQQIAATIKEHIAEYETSLVALRKKELEHKHGKLAKSELCPMCATPDVNGVCACLKKSELNKDQMSANYAKDVGITGPHTKAKASYGDGPHDQRPAMHMGAYGQMNPRIKDNTPKVKDKLDKSAMASSSASALSPPKARVATPVAAANHEMGGFKSIASKPPISSMGRAKASASGSI